MTTSVDSGVAERTREARLVLDQGQVSEAVDALERLQLKAPDDPLVRETLALARAAKAEHARAAEAALDEACAALEVGDLARAEACAAAAAAADPARLAALRDRLDGRRGHAAFEGVRPQPGPLPDEAGAPGSAWSRQALGVAFALTLGVGLLLASAGWERFVDSLVGPPRPRTRAATAPSLAHSSPPPAAAAGQR